MTAPKGTKEEAYRAFEKYQEEKDFQKTLNKPSDLTSENSKEFAKFATTRRGSITTTISSDSDSYRNSRLSMNKFTGEIEERRKNPKGGLSLFTGL